MKLQQRNMISSEDIYRDLCDKIVNLDYMPGDAISENELCERYGTSRHMVRGAFTMLKQKRLLEVYPQRGSFVSLIDLHYIADILFMREALEQECLQQVLDSGDVEAVCASLEENLEKQKLCAKNQEPLDAFILLDNGFHKCLLDAAGHPDIMKLLDDQYIHVVRWRNLEMQILMRQEQLIQEHEAILAGLKKKDRLAVRESMRRHMDTLGLEGSVREKGENEYFYKP